MSFVPKYQWLTEFKQHPCNDACDIVQIDADTDKKFQVAFTPTVLLNEDFDGNDIAYPMEQIWVGLGSFGSGSGTGLYYGMTFDLDQTNDNHFINSFSFFYNGQPYCYIFATDTTLSSNYTLTEYGNFKLIKIRFIEAGDYAEAFDNYFSEFGISSIVNSMSSVTVYGFPENTQVEIGNIAPYNTTIIEGAGERTFGLSNFLPYNNQVCYFNIRALGSDYVPTCTPSIYTLQVPVSANKRMIFTLNYTNNLSFQNIELELRVLNSSFVLVDTVVGIIDAGTNTITFNYETSFSDSYYFDFTLTDLICGFADEFYGFCFNLVKIETIAQLQTIEVQGCTTADVPFTEQYNDLYNSLITMNTGSLPNGLITTGKWKLVLTDDESNTWTSITYETIDGTDCTNRNLMRLVWTSDCKFADIDYLNLPFENDIYVKGYSTSQPLDNKERVINTLSTGELEMIYNYSLEKKEFTFGVYTESFYRTLQRAFEHKTITIDGVQYKQDTDSVLTKKPEGQKYSARIELVEVGTEVIITNCCC